MNLSSTRRRLLRTGALGFALAGWQVPGIAAAPKRVGFLAQIARPEALESHFFSAVPRHLRELGHAEPDGLVMDWRFAGGDVSRVPALASDLISAAPDVIVTAGTLAALAMHRAASSIPVVFGNVSDPLGSGFVKTLARPGTRMTGFASLSADINLKVAELLLDAAPGTSRLALLMNPLQPAHAALPARLDELMRQRRVRLRVENATTPPEIRTAFATMGRERIQAVVVPVEGLFIQQRRQLVELALEARIALGSSDNELAAAGGLLSYGANQVAMFRKVAGYVDRILRGARPEELPVEQPSAFDLTVNMKTARSLGLNLQQAVVMRADHLIE